MVTFFMESPKLAKGGLISESFLLGSNLPKKVPNHYPEHLLLRIVFGNFFGRFEPK